LAIHAVIAARAALEGDHGSKLSGLGTLQGKESPRLDVLASILRSFGIRVEADERSLTIGGVRTPPDRAGRPVFIDPRGDHRMAFAGALLGLVSEGVTVRDAGCVAKSWPGFFTAMRGAGANVHSAIP
jgi:3-phosphoshikimate 1-carboxyvinyltransferase